MNSSKVYLRMIDENCTKLGLNIILVWLQFISAFARYFALNVLGQADGSVYNYSS